MNNHSAFLAYGRKERIEEVRPTIVTKKLIIKHINECAWGRIQILVEININEINISIKMTRIYSKIFQNELHHIIFTDIKLL